MNQDILEFPILDKSGVSLFDRGDRYIVPIYQRAFAWGTGDNVRCNEIIQLMNDVADSTTAAYRLGSLVVARLESNVYEVIDGQQRLTALYLILSRLGVHVADDGLSYACRPSAGVALKSLSKGVFSSDDGVSMSDPASGIAAGALAVDQKIKSQPNPEEYCKDLIEKFKHVILCRVVVPENTDLNRYFEIMNTRGEQLEQQDIVKERLMRTLSSDVEKSAFATVWDACSDMDGYCQMNFHDKTQRGNLFYNCWTDLTEFASGAALLEAVNPRISTEADDPVSFRQIVLGDYEKHNQNAEIERLSRFESIIDFRHLLLHALKTFDDGEAGGTLDDGKLIDAFDSAVSKYKDDPADFVRAFILHLLRCRYLLDRYVIKREYDADGSSEWSLDELVANRDGGASYQNTKFVGAEVDSLRNNILMLEACLRVSYLDPKRMHWITRILRLLLKSGSGGVNGESLLEDLKSIARDEIRSFFAIDTYACMGVSTPHIVLNYLDYILWQRQEEVGLQLNMADFAKEFAFEYRSSVEHWYPQTPPNGVEWPDVDRFGNLCILRGDINSKFSNLLPKSKQLNHEQYLNLEHQSLKLRMMARITEQGDWTRDECGKLESKLLAWLREDADGLAISNNES